MSKREYKAFVSGINKSGAHTIIDLDTYLSSHYLPNWHPLLSDLTPETHIFPVDCDLQVELSTLGWAEFFIKDYVKSVKTPTGSRITKAEQVDALVENMRRFRGHIEGGFCVRRVENFLPDTERRYFVLNGVPYASAGGVPEIVHECSKRLTSPFYSVDVITRADGTLRIVEVGDGQVSDLVGWTPSRFAGVLSEHFKLGRE